MNKGIIIFDGECKLCNGVVGWLLKRLPENSFNFLPFQSPKGQILLAAKGYNTQELTTVILLDKNKAHTHSDAFIKILAKIPKWRRLANLLPFIPKAIRDAIYMLASKNRVKWFGKSKACTLSI